MSSKEHVAVYDPEADPEEDLAAVLSPAQRDILAGIGMGDLELAATLLKSLPEGTASLLVSYGVITDGRELTEFGAKVARQIAFEQGMAPQPSARAYAETLIAEHRSKGS